MMTLVKKTCFVVIFLNSILRDHLNRDLLLITFVPDVGGGGEFKHPIHFNCALLQMEEYGPP